MRTFSQAGQLAALAVVFVSVTTPGRATDAPLQHALRSVGCAARAIIQVAKHTHVTVYEVRCGAPAARVLTFSCDHAICRVEKEDEDPKP